MSGSASHPAIAIPNLLYRYADLFDSGDFEAAARLFDHGGVVVGGELIEGAASICAMWNSVVILYADGTPKTRHLTTNPVIELADDGQSATCRSQWTVLQALDDLPPQIIGSGRYHDELKLVAGEWAFASREYAKVDFWGDVSGHLKHDPANKVH
jgi:hypothetical protein